MALPEYRSVLRYFVFLIVLMSSFPCRDRDVYQHQIRIARADRPHPSALKRVEDQPVDDDGGSQKREKLVEIEDS